MRDGSSSTHPPPPAASTSPRAGREALAIAPLPLSRSPLIGRQHDIETIRDLLLRDDAPLVVLVGPGGVGKTRLALEVAREVEGAFADGVCFVALEAIRDPELVVPTVAQAFGLRDAGDRSLIEQLAAHLRPRQALLVLDNVEQVSEATPALDHLLTRCPGLKILATSRVVLRLSVEHDVPIHPLPAPAAVQLFVTRARAASPAFALTAANQTAVAAICNRLDGLPLAIELAAARVPALPSAALLARLERALPLLTGGGRDRPDRLRTMRGAIAWSYDPLDPAEQVLFHRLTVFAGGFDLAEAEAVAGVGGGLDALDGITSLVAKSIVQHVGGPEAEQPRYRMLETIREFGLEQLRESGDEPAIRAAHAAVVVEMAEHLSDRVWLPDSERVLARLDAEHDNVRAALVWAESAGEHVLGLRLARAMLNFWVVRGHFREARGWLERAVAWGEPTPTEPRARALVGVGWIATLQGELEAAEDAAHEALAASRAAGARLWEATALHVIALVHSSRGDFEQPAAWMEQALAVYQDVESTEVSGPQHVNNAYTTLGRIALARGDLAGATEYLAVATQRTQEIGFTWGLGEALRSLGDLARDSGNLAGAAARYSESVIMAQQHGDKRLLADALAGIASVAAAAAHAERAARLYGAVAALRGQLGTSVEQWERTPQEQGEAAARAALPPEAFAAAWAAGESLSQENVVAEALAGIAPVADAATILVPEAAALAGLTTRETEVLRLLAEGLSDREIAASLSLSPRTVGGHVTNLLAKLDLDSRTAAAVFAVRHGLA